MSQHFCDSEYQGKPVEVLIGWDKPLQQFFMVIEYKNDEDIPEDDLEGYVYSNLTDEELLKKPLAEMSLDYFKSKLEELNIQIPSTMFPEVEKDKVNNEGNKEVHHN